MTETSLTDPVFDPAVNMGRQSVYRFCALALSDPRVGSWEQVHERSFQQFFGDAAALLRNEPAARARIFARGELPLEDLDPALVFARLPDSPSRLNEAYEGTFGLLVSGTCPPYETEYVDSKFTFQRSQQLADVSGFYTAFGLQPSSQHPERQDHIVLELEFMAFLLGLERRAAESGEVERGERRAVCRDAQKRFFEEHLAWWVPTFSKLLSMADPEAYYGVLARFLAAFVPAERALLGIEVPCGTVGPSTVERPEECESCLLQP